MWVSGFETGRDMSVMLSLGYIQQPCYTFGPAGSERLGMTPDFLI